MEMLYIDNFTAQLIIFSLLLFLVFSMVFFVANFFAWVINETFDLNKSNNNVRYDNFF